MRIVIWNLTEKSIDITYSVGGSFFDRKDIDVPPKFGKRKKQKKDKKKSVQKRQGISPPCKRSHTFDRNFFHFIIIQIQYCFIFLVVVFIDIFALFSFINKCVILLLLLFIFGASSNHGGAVQF